MSDAVYFGFAEAMAIKNSSLQRIFARDGMRLILLKRNEMSKSFKEVLELVSGYRVEYGTGGLRDEIFLFYSTPDDMTDVFAQTTHIGYGLPNDENEVYVYEIQPEQKDVQEADIFSDEWKCFAVRLQNERYVPAL